MKEDAEVSQPWVDKVQTLALDAEIAALAERQHGVVALHQLQSAGLGRAAVAKRAQAGRLHRIHRGVYAVGRPGLTLNGRRMAAVLAYGPDAVLSHRSAAALWGLWRSARARIDVSLPRRSVRARPGIDVHGTSTLTGADITSEADIRVTTVARTLVDLGDVARRRTVEAAVEQAEVLRLFDLTAVEEALSRAGRRRGPALLSLVLTNLSAAPTLTASELEEAFLEIVREAGLQDPEVNAPLTLPDGTPAKIDFLWRARRLAVETDGHPFHRTRQSRERDAKRDQLLRLAGYDPLRFTGRQVAREKDWVRRTLLALASRADGDRPGTVGAQAARG
jgi:very-short-patch-repair endonuclease/predicted transcriptional regulator of viral defense system